MLPDIKLLLASGESATVEFKQSTAELREAMETLAGFANHKGGTVLFGVTNKGKIVGQQVSESTLRGIANSISQSVTPAIYPSVTEEVIDGKSIVVVTLPECVGKPYLAYGRAFKRVGSATLKMAQSEYERLLLERKRDQLSWDREIAPTATLSEIDGAAVRRFVRIANTSRNLDLSDRLPVPEILRGLDMMEGKQLRNAAIALFGKRPQSRFVQLVVRAARFKGTDKDEFIDNQLYSGNLLDAYSKIQTFFSSHIRISAKPAKGFKRRIDTPEYPLDALREASLNAIIHRDYYVPGGATEVAIYDDRIEIWNNGLLADGLTPKALYKPHRSIQRNPLLARHFSCMALSKRGDAER